MSKAISKSRVTWVVFVAVALLVLAMGGAQPAGAATNCFPPSASTTCATASVGGSIACGRVTGQIWCQGTAVVSGTGWSPVGLGPGTTTWSGAAAASWTCSGPCNDDGTPASKSANDVCTWDLGSVDGCTVGRTWNLPVVTAL